MKKISIKLFFVLVLMAGIMSCKKDVEQAPPGVKTSDAIMATETSTQDVTLALNVTPARPDIKRLPASLIIPNSPCTVSGARGYVHLRQTVSACVTSGGNAGTAWQWDEYSCNRGINHTGKLLWRGVGTITGCEKDTGTPSQPVAFPQDETPPHGVLINLPPGEVVPGSDCTASNYPKGPFPNNLRYANLKLTGKICGCDKTKKPLREWEWEEYSCDPDGFNLDNPSHPIPKWSYKKYGSNNKECEKAPLP